MKATDGLLSPPPKSQPSILVMSTGVTGQNLPIEKEFNGQPLGGGFVDWEKAAKAFMTTDIFPKLPARTFKIRDKEYAIAGINKGSGVIHPDMGPPAPSPSTAYTRHCWDASSQTPPSHQQVSRPLWITPSTGVSTRSVWTGTCQRTMAVEVHKKEITSHGREVARTRPISRVARASYSLHGQSGFPWGDFPPFLELN